MAPFRTGDFGQWVVLLASSGERVGFCGLREVTGAGDVELLYGLAPAHWGRGLATEAARAVLAHAFEACGLERVIGRTDPPNVASMRLLERSGMQREPPQPDGLVTYSITRAAFRATASGVDPTHV